MAYERKRFTQHDKLLHAFNNGRSAFNPKGLALDQDGHITYRSTIVGHIVENYDESDFAFAVLTLDNYCLPTALARKLAQTSNQEGLKVVFVPAVDYGFGVPEGNYLTSKRHRALLTTVAKCSSDDIKTAALMGTGDHETRPTRWKATAYSYNQFIGGYEKPFHAEATVAEYAAVAEISPEDRRAWLMDLEPCCNCLNDMLEQGARSIKFMTAHKAKWNTPEYLDLCDKIQMKEVLNCDGKPVIYDKEEL